MYYIELLHVFVDFVSVLQGLSAMPPSAFYCAEHKHLGENYVRFCFCEVRASLGQLLEM